MAFLNEHLSAVCEQFTSTQCWTHTISNGDVYVVPVMEGGLERETLKVTNFESDDYIVLSVVASGYDWGHFSRAEIYEALDANWWTKVPFDKVERFK